MAVRIVWTLCTSFLAGVFAYSLFEPALIVAYGLLAIASLALVCGVLVRMPALLLCAVAIGGGLMGGMRMDLGRAVVDARMLPHVGTDVSMRGMIVREPDVRDRSVRLTVATAHGRVLVIAPPHTDAAYGDEISFEGTLRRPKAFESGEGRLFDYPKYLERDGVFFEVRYARVAVLSRDHGNPVVAFALTSKHRYIDGLRAVLPEPYAGLAAGITVGDKRSVGPALSAVFMSVSLVHILVLSGYNMTLVMNIVASLFRFLPRVPFMALNACVIVFITLMAGASASATRAGAMAALSIFARTTGRMFVALRVLMLVACAMVLWNPYALLYDPGFQLSMLATLGLITFTPMIASALPRVPERFGLKEIVASTIATQTMVVPLLLFQNGTFSIVSLPTNIAALVVVPFAMAASFVAAVMGMVFGSAASIFAYPAYVALAYIIDVAQLFASIPHTSVSVPAFSGWVLAGVYLLFGAILLKKKQPAFGRLVSLNRFVTSASKRPQPDAGATIPRARQE